MADSPSLDQAGIFAVYGPTILSVLFFLASSLCVCVFLILFNSLHRSPNNLVIYHASL